MKSKFIKIIILTDNKNWHYRIFQITTSLRPRNVFGVIDGSNVEQFQIVQKTDETK